MRSLFCGCVLTLAALLGFGARSTVAGDDSEDDPWARLERPGVELAEVIKNIEEHISALRTEGSFTSSGAFTAFAHDEAPRGKTRAQELDERVKAGQDILATSGLSLEAGAKPVVVVYLRTPRGHPEVLISKGGAHILVREPRVRTVTPLPPQRPRMDVPDCERAVVRDAERMTVALGQRTLSVRTNKVSGSTVHIAVEVLLNRVQGMDEWPPWLRTGVAAWLAQSLAPNKPAAIHLCGSHDPRRSPKRFPRVLARDDLPPPVARLLGRVLARVGVERPGVLAKILADAGESEGPVPVFKRALGVDFLALAAEVAEAVAEPEPSCLGDGRLPCPMCRATGSVPIACPVCVGLKRAACPSCGGVPYCPCEGCAGGERIDVRGRPACALCSGYGGYYCYSCKNKATFRCRYCNGKGKEKRVCPVCAGARWLPCLDGSHDPEPGGRHKGAQRDACQWCSAKDSRSVCGGCFGTGLSSRDVCRGAGRVPCSTCEGKGCTTCRRFGADPCPACDPKEKLSKCVSCKGKGSLEPDAAGCLWCAGSAMPPSPADLETRLAKRSTLTGADLGQGDMLERAIEFLMSVQDERRSNFRLRRFRLHRDSDMGAAMSPGPFANAMCLWALTAAGVPADDGRLERVWESLTTSAAEMVAAHGRGYGIQAVSLTLRALVSGRRDIQGKVVKDLVKLILKAQHTDGLWGGSLDRKGESSAYDALFPVESLFLAERAGVTVPGTFWFRVLTGARKAVKSASKARGKGSHSGTDVASGVALVVMAKVCSSKRTRLTREELLELPAVSEGLAWLDRHFDVEHPPMIRGGAPTRNVFMAGFAAWLYSAQRLAQLLSIPEFGRVNWYTEGTQYLRGVQLEDGSFEEFGPGRLNGPVRCTCAAILFLVRATPSVTAMADDR